MKPTSFRVSRAWLAIVELCLAATVPGSADTLDLKGRVINGGGAPVAGAEVLIHTAGPRVGTSAFCPSCYPDCRKRTTTDAAGGFEIRELDEALIFRVLVVAKDHVPAFVAKVDPGAGPVEARLERIDWASIPAERRFQGRLLGPEGEPVIGATVSVEGVETERFSRWGGVKEVDPLAVSDREGGFVLSAKEPLKAVRALVEARNLAKQWVRLVPGGTAMVRMKVGAGVGGRVVAGTTPLTNVVIGIAGANRVAGEWMGDFQALTDVNGRFAVANLPAGFEYYVYGTMGSLRDRGAIVARKFQAGADGSESEVEDLAVVKAHRLAGRIRLSDDAKVPSRTRLLMAREDAWDTVQVEVDEQGRFEIRGVPPETVSLVVRVKGYRLAEANPSLDVDSQRLIGRVVGDIRDLDILLERGEWRPGRELARVRRNISPKDEPLRGAKE